MAAIKLTTSGTLFRREWDSGAGGLGETRVVVVMAVVVLVVVVVGYVIFMSRTQDWRNMSEALLYDEPCVCVCVCVCVCMCVCVFVCVCVCVIVAMS